MICKVHIARDGSSLTLFELILLQHTRHSIFHLQYCYSGVSAAPDTALQTATPVTESTSAPGTTSTVTAPTAEATTVTQAADVPVTQQPPAGE